MVKLDFQLAGNSDSKTLLIFLQGWPDNHKMWEWINWRQDLSQHRILFIDFPNTNGKITHKWGVDVPQIVQGLKDVIDSVGEVEHRIFIAHDWGAYYAYIFDQNYKGYIHQIIAMDVPPTVELSTLKTVLMVVSYQLLLVLAFLVGGSVGTLITKKWCQFAGHKPSYFSEITHYQNYPYYYVLKNRVLSLLNKDKRYLKPQYKPEVPFAYLYGTKKPFQFHGEKTMRLIEKNKDLGFEMHPMEAGHWFMKKYPKFITELINRRAALRL